jgi:20S proteasome alpha/beta subunit
MSRWVTLLYFFVFLFGFDSANVRLVFSSSAAGSETLIGIKGKDFVLLASSTGLSGNGGVAFTSTFIDKIHIFQPSDDTTTTTTIIPTIAIAAVGNYADIDHLTRRIRAEYDSFHYESLTFTSRAGSTRELEVVDCHPNHLLSNKHYESTAEVDWDILTAEDTVLSVDQIVQMARNQIMTKLRSASPYHICTLIAGGRFTHHPNGGSDENNDNNNTATSTANLSSTTKIELAEHLQQQVRIAKLNRMFPNNDNTDDTANQQQPTDGGIVADLNTDDSSRTELVKEPPLAVAKYEPLLYWLDEYGSMIDDIPYGVHGYASDMIYSILDQKYHSSLSREQAQQLLDECIQQLQTRYMMNTQQQSSSSSLSSQRKSFCIKLIDQHGCTLL